MTRAATAAAETDRIESETASEEKFLISMIEIGERHRKDFGDLDALASSIKKQGLLQPIGINQDFELVFGERRLRACRDILKWEEIPVRFVDVESILDGEVDENAMRKNHTVSELVAIVDSLKKFTHGGDRRSDQTRTSEDEALTIDQAAKRVGLGNKDSYYRAKKVVENGVSELIEKMDRGDISIAAAVELVSEAADQQVEILSTASTPLTVSHVKKLKKAKVPKVEKVEQEAEPEIEPLGYPEDRWDLHQGNVEDILPTLPDNHFEGVFTDPPYGLGFMNQSWDGQVPPVSVWKEILRVCKPGAYMLAFGGTRTWHRLAVAIEDAGWDIRDTIMWLYGEGFPKGRDISIAIDHELGAERQVIKFNPNTRNTPLPKREFFQNGKANSPITEPATPEAAMWTGYHTQLKPGWEPIILARKPVEGTFGENALKWECGGLNIDGCRLDLPGELWQQDENDKGRWPANVIISEDVAQDLDQQNDASQSRRGLRRREGHVIGNGKTMSSFASKVDAIEGYNDEGGPSRYFYCPKASPREKTGNDHPTVKPLKLCEYLGRLIVQPECQRPQNLLVPFAGSGSEMLGGLMGLWDHVTGIESSAVYVETARQRLSGQSTTE